jgi:uncharacterized protein (DUF58 family)
MTAWPRPAAVSRSVLASGAVGLGLVAIARTTGAGWLMVLVSGLVAVVLVGAVVPAAGLAAVSFDATAPRDGTVGRPLLLTIRIARRTPLVKIRALDPPGDWAAAEGPLDGQLVVTPQRRGVVTSLRFEVRSAAPLGLIWWRRLYHVPLDRPLEVGPRPVETATPRLESSALGGQRDRRTTAAPDDLVRSVREYTAGDPIKLVHWPASARAGDLVVKELEAPDRPFLAIAVDLRGAPSTAERSAEHAASVALAALAEGYAVMLLTAEARGPVAAPVAMPIDVSRRLARAIAGPLPALPARARGATVVQVGP